MKVYIINSITKSYILNIKIRPLVTEYALMIKLLDRTSSTHSFNPYVFLGHSWSYFDIQNLQLVILYTFDVSFNSTTLLLEYFNRPPYQISKILQILKCIKFSVQTFRCIKTNHFTWLSVVIIVIFLMCMDIAIKAWCLTCQSSV